jgi:cytidyltransferase-like protein
MKIVYYESAFNPPHLGHMDVIDQLRGCFDRVIVGASVVHH